MTEENFDRNLELSRADTLMEVVSVLNLHAARLLGARYPNEPEKDRVQNESFSGLLADIATCLELRAKQLYGEDEE